MAREWRSGGSVERVVPATPEAVYRVVTDVTSTGERSDECRSAEWLPGGPAAAEVGARFRGHNRSGLARWSRVCEVVAAEPGRRFAFRTVPERFDPTRADSTTWSYELEPVDGGTRVRHSYEITRMPWPPLKAAYGILLSHHRDMRPAMRLTLERLAQRLAPDA
ncbi:MAG TPA: SRPBCC family protein [Marmoricola sp.]|nr:SRPBCC family protein [Marmoricola sp.]